eukprot:scaffold55556_cov24-Tisochrysis_lutea.AAC.1
MAPSIWSFSIVSHTHTQREGGERGDRERGTERARSTPPHLLAVQQVVWAQQQRSGLVWHSHQGECISRQARGHPQHSLLLTPDAERHCGEHARVFSLP